MTRLVYLDTETTGLDPVRHEVWQAAWAFDVVDSGVHERLLHHHGFTADREALEMNGYLDGRWSPSAVISNADETLFKALDGATIVGANPAFDTAFLRARWGVAPWKHRLLDIEAYAAGVMGWGIPWSLAYTAQALRDLGHEIHESTHDAVDDVMCLRDVHWALRDIVKARS